MLMLEDAYRTVTSKAVRRTLVYGVLLATASALLYGVAVVGYLGFYHDYVPHRVRTSPLYLQYGTAAQHPFAIADLRGLSLKTDQAYDVSVSVRLPRSPANQAVGNVMLELALVTAGLPSFSASSSSSTPDAITTAARLPPDSPRDFLAADGRRVVYAATRPALLAYVDPLVATAGRLVFLPYHLLAPAAAPESDRLVVSMAESLSFAGVDALPAALYLELRVPPTTGQHQQLQTYGVDVVFAARLRGLRWLMYHHAVASFVVLTAAFWLVEVLFMAAACALLGTFLAGSADVDADADTKAEGGDDGSDQGRMLPTVVKTRADEDVSIKKEEDQGGRRLGRSLLASIPARAVGHADHQADDHVDDPVNEEADRPAAITTGSSAVATESSLRQRQQQQIAA